MNKKGVVIALETEDDVISMTEFLNSIDTEKEPIIPLYFTIHCLDVTIIAEFSTSYKLADKETHVIELFNIPYDSLLINIIEKVIEKSKVPYMSTPMLLDPNYDQGVTNYILHSDDFKDLVEFMYVLSEAVTVYPILDEFHEVEIAKKNAFDYNKKVHEYNKSKEEEKEEEE